MTHPKPLHLIIDGNNLAHYLFSIPDGQKLTPELDGKLVQHLSGWLEENQDVLLRIDLCLDFVPQEIDSRPHIRLLSGYPYSADEIILHQVEAYRWSGLPFLVISSDQSLMDEVKEAGGTGLSVFEFVRLPGCNYPRFLPARDLPRRIRAPQASQAENTPTALAHAVQIAGQMKTRQTRRPRPTPSARTQLPEIMPQEENPAAPPVPVSPLPELPAGPVYRLSLENWPPERGARFLLSSFCPQHRALYSDLMVSFNLHPLRPADVRVLADLLLEACGQEPDFTHRGCPLDRVRLALLQTPVETLTLKELATSTGCKPGELYKKLKEKGAPWLRIDPSFQV